MAPAGTRAVRGLLRDPSFGLAARLYQALVEVAPEGALLKALAAHLDVALADVGPALALLDRFGVIEFGPDRGEGRPVAIERNFLKVSG
jgi:hypothetical protein